MLKNAGANRPRFRPFLIDFDADFDQTRQLTLSGPLFTTKRGVHVSYASGCKVFDGKETLESSLKTRENTPISPRPGANKG